MNIRSLFLLGCVFLLMGATALVILFHPAKDRRNFGSASEQIQLDAWKQQARELYQENRIPDAERRIRRILEINPEDPDMLLLFARICRESKRYQEAEHHLRILVRKESSDPLFFNNLAVIQLFLGKNGSARENQEQSVMLAPGNPFYLANLAAALRAADAPEEAQYYENRSRKMLTEQKFILPDDLFLAPQSPAEAEEEYE